MFCRNCEKDVEPFTSEQIFSNGKMHIKGSCPECKRYLKYLPQYLPKIKPMKLTSTNITLIANEKIGQASIRQNRKAPTFIEEQHLEELRDLLNDYFEMKNNL
jgi:hypothetical protein